MQITIPENLSTRLRQLAARQRQPVETIVADRLFIALDDELDKLLTDEQAELRTLHHLSEDNYAMIRGITPISRATIDRFKMNRPRIVLARKRWTLAGLPPVVKDNE